MCKLNIFCLAVLSLMPVQSSLCAPPVKVTPGFAPRRPHVFTYQNPLSRSASGINGLRDPFILRVDGTWYMTGTSKPFFEQLGDAPGVPLYSSSNLKTWKDEGLIIVRKPGSWYQDRFWAPEIHVKQTLTGRKFYCTFNCFNKDAHTGQGVGLAIADKIKGPYVILTPDKPLAPGNDADIFTDDDGQDYLFVAGVTARTVDLANAAVGAETWPVVPGGAPTDWDTGAGIGREGPEVIKIKGTYYCFYSSWGRGYEVGYATATNIHGPWKKAAQNPIYGAQSPAVCARYHKTYTQNPNVPYNQVGHGEPFIGPDGRWWISAHFGTNVRDPLADARLNGNCQPGYDPLNFRSGVFLPTNPTWTPQTVPLPLPPRRTRPAGH